jgi:hypothetical protein
MNSQAFTSPACGRGRQPKLSRRLAGEGCAIPLTAKLRFTPLPQAGEVRGLAPC